MKTVDPNYIITNYTTNATLYDQKPEPLQKDDLRYFFEKIAPIISILFKFGPDRASRLKPQQFFYYKRKYTRKFQHYLQIYKYGIQYFAELMYHMLAPIVTKITEINRIILIDIPKLHEYYQNEQYNHHSITTLRELKAEMLLKHNIINSLILEKQVEIQNLCLNALINLYLNKIQKRYLKEKLDLWINGNLKNQIDHDQIKQGLINLIKDFCDFYEETSPIFEELNKSNNNKKQNDNYDQ